jgi:hypothetical protein
MAGTLVVDKLTKWFGNLVAVSQLSFKVQEGEIPGMMGQWCGHVEVPLLANRSHDLSVRIYASRMRAKPR